MLPDHPHQPHPIAHFVDEGAQHHRGVGIELARKQSLQIQVCLELAVELLAVGVKTIQSDDLRIYAAQGPPAFYLHPGDQQLLTLAVDTMLNHPLGPAVDAFDPVPFVSLVNRQAHNMATSQRAFPGGRVAEWPSGRVAKLRGIGRPVVLRFPTQIHLDDIVDFFGVGTHPNFQGIIPAVEAYQQRP